MPSESAIRNAAASRFELIETLRWQPDSGFVRLERHLARLAASARELGFVFDAHRIENALQSAVDPAAAKRVRLVLAPDGQAQCTTSIFNPLAPGTIWRLALAVTKLDETDPLLAHKTTRRAPYEAARAEFTPEETDEVILTNRGGELCEGTITNLFVDMGDGRLLTPALACGLLPGVLRAELIDTGRAAEAVLDETMLAAARKLYVGNSLRGLIPAVLVESQAVIPGDA